MKQVAHAFVVGCDNGNQVEVWEHKDELITSSAPLFTAILSVDDFVVLRPPEVPVRRFSTSLADWARGALDKLGGKQLLAIPLAVVQDQQPILSMSRDRTLDPAADFGSPLTSGCQ